MATRGLRKPEKALTAKQVENLREPGKYFDGHGLFLRVQPNGARQWVQRITIRGKRTELGLGSPPLVSLAEAREQALANRRMAVSGGNRYYSDDPSAITFANPQAGLYDIWIGAYNGGSGIPGQLVITER